jgi:hypothetical protein
LRDDILNIIGVEPQFMPYDLRFDALSIFAPSVDLWSDLPAMNASLAVFNVERKSRVSSHLVAGHARKAHPTEVNQSSKPKTKGTS